MASLSSFPSALCEEDDVTKQGLLVMEFVSERDGGSEIAGSLGAVAWLLQTAVSHTSGSDTLLHTLLHDGTPATSMTP